MPVILLAFDETEIKQLSQKLSPSAIDRVFIWSGDASVFPAIIKYVEDRKNAEQDIVHGDVRAIILIEDSPRMYSILLPMIYREIIFLTKSGFDILQKIESNIDYAAKQIFSQFPKEDKIIAKDFLSMLHWNMSKYKLINK